jgi:hypothetical protein
MKMLPSTVLAPTIVRVPMKELPGQNGYCPLAKNFYIN